MVVVEVRLRLPGAALRVNGLENSGWLLDGGKDVVESGLDELPSLSGRGMSSRSNWGIRAELRYSLPTGLSRDAAWNETSGESHEVVVVNTAYNRPKACQYLGTEIRH